MKAMLIYLQQQMSECVSVSLVLTAKKLLLLQCNRSFHIMNNSDFKHV